MTRTSFIGFIAPKNLNYLPSNLSILSEPDEGYSRNLQCALNLVSTFLLQTIHLMETWHWKRPMG
jgi:hypothetical protein